MNIKLSCCPLCGSLKHWTIVERKIEQIFRGESFWLDAHVFTCSNCGFKTMESSERDRLVHATWEAYREMKNGIKKPYTVDEIIEVIESNDYSAEMMLQHAMANIQDLRRQLGEARKDSERLDSIEKSGWCVAYGLDRGYAVSKNPFWQHTKFYPTLRQAADAAMEDEQ